MVRIIIKILYLFENYCVYFINFITFYMNNDSKKLNFNLFLIYGFMCLFIY